MVKIFRRESDRNEERLEERAARLYDVARDRLGKETMVINFADTISVEEGEIDVYPHLRAIAVYTRKNYKRAQELARIYEQRFKEEFVIFDYTQGGKIDAPQIAEITV